jgi:general secretion pathway protein D
LHLSLAHGIISHVEPSTSTREIAMRIKTETRVLVSLLLTFCLLLLPATALAKKGEKNFKQGLSYESAQQWEKAAQEFTLAVAADPSNLEYQLHFRRASFNASQSYMQQGRALAEQRDFVGAYNAFRQAYGYDTVNQLAVSEMDRMLQLQAIKEGTNNRGNGNGTKSGELQEGSVSPVSGQAQEAPAPGGRTEQLRVISYSGDLKAFIRSLAEQLNLNVIFDRQSFVQPRNIDINLRDVTTAQALDYIFLQEGLFFQKLSRRTIVVADQTRRPQYQQLVLRTFFLANSDPEKAKSLVGQAIPPSVGRPQTIVVADKDTNSLTVRDTAENIRLIGDLLKSIDKDRAEVVMDVNIYEVSRSDLMQFGNQIGNDTGLVNLGGMQSAVATFNGISNAVTGASGIPLPTSFGAALILPASTIQALQRKQNTKLIASTQVHAFNGEESTARIGQRVPVQTAQAYPFGIQTGTPNNSTGFPTGGFPVINYEPTGLTLKFTPQVFPNQDVQVKMSIESKDVLGASTLTPTFTERTITGTARVQNNRTMMLASVSTDSQSNGRTGLPLLGLIPVLGRFFTSPTKDYRRIDIVIAVTPRVLRAPSVTPRDEEMRPSGTLQSPTTGSLEAMMREADRDDQLAAARVQKQNTTAKAVDVAPPSIVPLTVKSEVAQVPGPASTNNAAPPAVVPLAVKNEVTQAPATVSANNPTSPAATVATNAGVAKDSGVQPTTKASQKSASTPAPAEELPAFVPAPKSLVSNTAASQVAAVNTNLSSGTAQAVRTSFPKPIESAVNAVSTPVRTAQMSLSSADETMKVGEKRWFSLKLNSGVSLAMAVVALRFDPRVVKVGRVSAGTLMANVQDPRTAGASFSQSVDPAGTCLISISNLNGAASLKGAGTLLFVEVEAIAAGDAGLKFAAEASRLVAVDSGDIALDVAPVRAIVKQ